MPVNLQLEHALDQTPQTVKDDTGGDAQIAISSNAVGIGTTEPERRLDVSGEFRTYSVDAGNKKGVEISYFGDNRNRILSFDRTRNVYLDLFIEAGRHGQGLTVAASGNVGIGVTAAGKEFEVVGNLVSRQSPDPGGTAVAFAAEDAGLGSLWTNRKYDPAAPGSGWKRTINLFNGNVGIGLNLTAPGERLEVEGNIVAGGIQVNGDIVATGDVRLAGADCAEEFYVDPDQEPEPGTVLIIADEGRLGACVDAYDSRVAGVVSGASGYQPGIVLDSRHSREPLSGRRAVALAGKVFCKVDAQYAPIRAGDLLTTSPTPGHAMKAADPGRGIGAILGKSLQPLAGGCGLIPILVSLQ